MQQTNDEERALRELRDLIASINVLARRCHGDGLRVEIESIEKHVMQNAEYPPIFRGRIVKTLRTESPEKPTRDPVPFRPRTWATRRAHPVQNRMRCVRKSSQEKLAGSRTIFAGSFAHMIERFAQDHDGIPKRGPS